MKNLKRLIGKDIILWRTSPFKLVLDIKLVECFRNNTLLVSCSNISRVRVGQRYQIRYDENNVTYHYRVEVVRVCNESSLCLQLILPGQQQRPGRMLIDKKQIRIILQDGSQKIPVDIVDISVSGAKLVSKVRLGKINDVFNIELTLDNGARSIRLPCKIRYVRSEFLLKQFSKNDSFHHGVEFLQLATNVENFLYRFVG